MKNCTICKEDKRLSEFYSSKRHPSGYMSACKLCESKRKKSANSILHRRKRYQMNKEKVKGQVKANYHKHLDKYKATARNYYLRNKDKSLEAGWKQKGILNDQGSYFTLSDYKVALEKCNNCCQICKRRKEDHKKGLVVDHNHQTGYFRGILCAFCNTAIGYLKEDPDIIKQAADYVAMK